ncbi:hypothetical protein PHYSODRAFT_250699 [Phytophthora sojae]|uniref:Uncharacterized protein n=1 Tax=Phytophthora sojae (strain P6497) TaxID=1094619 RepID=G4ZVQ2_PHYSP|nr:hypothetical protein PHYSODRAFT_250699 [Phytophthora sojae]EGZ11516.1 hypothetical protein PHYSODRAFT_250699 [Phytophthora sojae]|eukprot:XP_009531849.1 hypothetical protein PHYSODRAFT_250699 [Phytophthora sojae]
MARAKFVQVVVQSAKRVTRNQPAGQTQTTVPAPAVESNPGRPENEAEDEETEESEPVREASPSDGHDERGGDDAPSETQEPNGRSAGPAEHDGDDPGAHGLRHAAQQPPAPVTNPSASTSTSQAPAAPQQDQPAATRRQVVFQSTDDGDDGGDSSDDDDSSSSSSDDDSDGNDGGGRRGRRQLMTRPGDGDFHRNRRRTIRDWDLPTFLPTPQTSVTTWIARVDLALEGARLSGRGGWTDQELYYILGNKLQDNAARWWVQMDTTDFPAVVDDGDTACMTDTSTVPATVATDKGKHGEAGHGHPALRADDGGDDQVSGAVTDHSTVDMTMVTKRATTEMTTADESPVTAPSPAPAHTDEVPISEEGGEPTDEVGLAEEGGTAATMETSPLELGMELTDEAMVKLGNVAKVRKAVKRSKRAAKQLRVQRAHEKTKDKRDDDEVARVVAELEAERVLRRRRQADEVRDALEARRQQRAAGDEMRVDERARVNLVWHDSATVDEEADGGGDADVTAGDGLPTAEMIVDGTTQQDWRLLVGVPGVWTFEMANVYGQKVTIEACIIEGFTSVFLVGADFLGGRGATMDFDRGEVRYAERGRDVIIPFRTTEAEDDSAVAAVRSVSATNVQRRAVQTVEVAIAAPDDEEGVFLPTVNNGVVLLAAAVTKVEKGKALVPVINPYGGRIKLPSRKELDIELLTMHGELQPERVQAWLNELGDTNTPSDDEHDVDIGAEEPDARTLILRLLRAYRDLANA